MVELRTPQEITELIEDEFHKKVTRQAVWLYKNSKKWKPIVQRLRKRFEKNITKIPIANKTDRLRILQKVIDEGLKWSLKGYSKTNLPIYELKLGAVIQAVQASRIEVEGDTPAVKVEEHTHFTNINVKDLESKNEKELIDTILGRANGSCNGASNK